MKNITLLPVQNGKRKGEEEEEEEEEESKYYSNHSLYCGYH
jgi:hypothetical protein